MAIVIDLLRHGDAAPASEGGDAARRLTERGRSNVAWIANQVAAGPRPTRLFSSPLARARETAELVAQRLNGALAIEGLPELGPECEPEDVLQALSDRGIASGHVLMVGHQPLIGRLASHLTGTELPVPPATLIRISCESIPIARSGRLERTWSPAVIGGNQAAG
ncbi:MAG TPA: histidine phosphatase family protein [Candidatus Sulfotelmatobacter sp.]|nr:histidine phosphatase family protein [Candidatus Sulfotelmatobacter sp.]